LRTEDRGQGGEECRERNEHRKKELGKKYNSHPLSHFEVFERHSCSLECNARGATSKSSLDSSGDIIVQFLRPLHCSWPAPSGAAQYTRLEKCSIRQQPTLLTAIDPANPFGNFELRAVFDKKKLDRIS
jgi:hypothetical protein